MNLSSGELQKAKDYNIYIPDKLNENIINNIRYQIKNCDFRQTLEYKKYEQVVEKLLDRDNVIAVALASKPFDPIIISIVLGKKEPFPTEIEGMKTAVSVKGEFIDD